MLIARVFQRMTCHRWVWVALALCALWYVGSGAYILAKAGLAQILLERAWQRTVDGGQHERPWGWADTWPVARLALPDRDVELIVLEGASGRNLAFGPAHLSSTPLPGAAGNSVIVGHRDTHFDVLEEIATGDTVIVELTRTKLTYRVTQIVIVHESDVTALRDTPDAALTLITCYPFDALDAGTPLRYVVRGELM